MKRRSWPVVAEYGTAYDTLQSITYGIMGGDKSEWHDKLEAHLDNVSSNLPSFRYLVTPGTGHIALNTPRLYQDGVDGVISVRASERSSTAFNTRGAPTS